MHRLGERKEADLALVRELHPLEHQARKLLLPLLRPRRLKVMGMMECNGMARGWVVGCGMEEGRVVGWYRAGSSWDMILARWKGKVREGANVWGARGWMVRLRFAALTIWYGTTHSGYGTTPVGCRGGNRYVEGDLLAFG